MTLIRSEEGPEIVQKSETSRCSCPIMPSNFPLFGNPKALNGSSWTMYLFYIVVSQVINSCLLVQVYKQ